MIRMVWRKIHIKVAIREKMSFISNDGNVTNSDYERRCTIFVEKVEEIAFSFST